MTPTDWTKAFTIFLAGFAAMLLAATFYAWKATSPQAYEMAEYQVVQRERVFEIREYPELALASTAMAVNDADHSFMRLFRYISGENDSQRKIAMTVPVFMDRSSEKQPGHMSFVLPRALAQAEAPAPANDYVTLTSRAAGRFAVIRFAGGITARSSARAEARLREWMRSNGVAATDEVELAGYDPPWTPAIFRRNEVLIRLK